MITRITKWSGNADCHAIFALAFASAKWKIAWRLSVAGGRNGCGSSGPKMSEMGRNVVVLLNVVMLIHPVGAIKAWQAGH